MAIDEAGYLLVEGLEPPHPVMVLTVFLGEMVDGDLDVHLPPALDELIRVAHHLLLHGLRHVLPLWEPQLLGLVPGYPGSHVAVDDPGDCLREAHPSSYLAADGAVVDAVGLASPYIVEKGPGLDEVDVYVMAPEFEGVGYSQGQLGDVDAVAYDVVGGVGLPENVDGFPAGRDAQSSSSSFISAIFFSRNSMMGAFSTLFSGSSQ